MVVSELLAAAPQIVRTAASVWVHLTGLFNAPNIAVPAMIVLKLTVVYKQVLPKETEIFIF